MASHVVVIDSTARRHTIKTTPNKYLSDVLQEACAKFGLNPDQYGLKHNNKPVDLSRTLRLSGLSSGAKLDLVQASRSPSVISVALQLPDSPTTSSGVTGSLVRLTDKFPSDTPIWQILRRFEAGVAGGGSEKPNYNFTQRATPQMSNGGETGAGRLCYEMPVVNFMGRELSSFLDMQKTLGQLGFNSGTCLLRLNYRKTERPLEEAMTEISQYFKAVEEPTSTVTDMKGAHGAGPASLQSKPDSNITTVLNGIAGEPTSPVDTPMDLAPAQDVPITSPQQTPAVEPISPTSEAEPVQTTQAIPPSSDTAISIFAPPSSTTPLAATQSTYNEADYVPTIAHATLHQARLATSSQNKKLLSDAELDAQHAARSAALSDIAEVVVRIRFPDQSQAQRSFARDATVNSLYDMCKELMARPNDEGFLLRAAGGRMGTSVLAAGEKKLIADLGWQGRVLVTVAWGDEVSAATRKGASLKEEYRAKAEDLKVEMTREAVEEEDGVGKAGAAAAEQEGAKGKGKAGPEKEAKMMRFLKGLSKK